MKHVPMLLLLGMALSLCSLTERLKKSVTRSEKDGSSPSATGSNSSDAEKPNPTAAQLAALAGGQDFKWDKQGISFTVPAKWTKLDEESKEVTWSTLGSDGGSLSISISAMNEDFPTDDSIKAFYDQAKSRAKNGEVDEYRWLAIDELKGVQFRESNPEKPDGIRRLQWQAFRKYAGQVQMVNVILSSSGKGFPTHQDELYGILYSIKLVH
jgi:hypothetical protein